MVEPTSAARPPAAGTGSSRVGAGPDGAAEVEEPGQRRLVGHEPGDSRRGDEFRLDPAEHRRPAGAGRRHAVAVGAADRDHLGQAGNTEDRLRPGAEVTGRRHDGDADLGQFGGILPELPPPVGQPGGDILSFPGRTPFGEPGGHRVEEGGGREGEETASSSVACSRAQCSVSPTAARFTLPLRYTSTAVTCAFGATWKSTEAA